MIVGDVRVSLLCKNEICGEKGVGEILWELNPSIVIKY